ncbi:MAG: sigma-70 family RNA polymerase sigma factor [Planctomycetota bacterium]
MTRPLEDLLQHTVALRRLARDLVGDGAADDLLQDAAVVALREGAPADAAARGWWFGVVRNLAGKWRRAEATRRRHEAEAARDDVHRERSVEAADSLRWLTAELTALPEPYRAALLARYVRDLSPTEIAAETGEPVRTVKTRLQRGLALLRERFEVRGGDWRAGLVAAFGLERAATKAAGAVVTVIGGAMLMNTTAKMLVGAAAVIVLAAGLWWWQPWRAEVDLQQRASNEAAAATGDGGEVAVKPATSAPVAAEAPVEVERQAVASGGSANEAAPAVVDSIVVVVHDADDGTPVIDFGLRRHRMTKLDLMSPQTPLLFAGEHDGGRLLLPVAELGRDNFVVEVADDSYLPSRWFDAADVHEVDGQRVIDVALAKPVEQVVRVVLEGKSTPVAGSVVELLRPWPGHEAVMTLRTIAQPSDTLRAQVDESPMAVAMIGGRALLLERATTDADGRVTLRVPPDEDLALRLLGPGHQPRVETPWRIERATAAVERVVAVRDGASIEFRAFPPEALRALQLPPVPDEWRERIRHLDALLADLVTGVWLLDPATRQTRPAQRGFSIPGIPFDDDGRLRVEGLSPGDWVPTFTYPLRCEPARDNPLEGWGSCRIELPTVRGLQPNELRIVDLDLSGFLPGTLQATVALHGHARPDGPVLLWAVDATSAGLPRFQVNLRPDEHGRFAATLPPATYFARWSSRGEMLPLGEFAIRSGQPTEHAFVVDVVAVQVRVLDADGGAAPAGAVVVERPGLRTSGETDANGLATVPEQLRGDTLRVSYCARTGELPNGRASYGPPVALGELTAGASTEPVTFRLPKP